ncbi:MAG: aminodeoxychorismate synthase component I [Pseudomonadota bacterium]
MIPLNYSPQSDLIFDKLQHLPYACWLDSGKPYSHYGRYDIISALPQTVISVEGNTSSIQSLDPHGNVLKLDRCNSDPIQCLQQYLSHLEAPPELPESCPFMGGAIGYFGYDLGRRYMNLSAGRESRYGQRAFPDMIVGIYHWAIIQDHLLKQSYLIKLRSCGDNQLEHIQACLQAEAPQTDKPFRLTQLYPSITRQEYLAQIDKVHEYILAGDCYQVNLAQRFQGQYSGRPYWAYQRLRREMASPFSAYLQFGEKAILSLSPERFLEVKNGKVTTQPIKGTIARSADADIDQQRGKDLKRDDKNQAENLMIVDLLRNDLGKHCEPGSIHVDELFSLQSFPNVHHLVSTISGHLCNKSSSLDLLRDCFPGGSITGAPKLRAMQIIDELECGFREVYCGSIGYIGLNGDMDTNIAIRTVYCDGARLYCWGGGGIVADSQADSEYQESLDKINKILSVLSSLPKTGL